MGRAILFILSQLAGQLIPAALRYFGYDPEKIANKAVQAIMGRVSHQVTSLEIQAALFVFVLAVWLIVWTWRYLRNFDNKMIPLKEGVRLTYDELHGTLWGKAADRFGGSPEDKLDYLGTTIAHKVPIFGKRPPSTQFDPVTKQDLNGGTITDGATSLKYYGKDESMFVELSLKRGDLRRWIKEMSNLSEQIT